MASSSGAELAQNAQSGAAAGTSAAVAVGVSPPCTKARDNAITWPFHQRRWLPSLMIVLVGWFPLPLPMSLSFGWLLDAAARRARGNDELLPRPRDILHLYVHGLVFWLALLFYFVIPLMIFSAIFSAEIEAITEDTGEWVSRWLLNFAIQTVNFLIALFSSARLNVTPQESFAALFLRELTAYSEVVIALVIYNIVALALFLAGALRYATTGRIGGFFALFKNFGLVVAHLPRFLWAILLIVLTNTVLAAIPVVGNFLWLTAGVWIIAYVIGQLGKKVLHAVAKPALTH